MMVMMTTGVIVMNHKGSCSFVTLLEVVVDILIST